MAPKKQRRRGSLPSLNEAKQKKLKELIAKGELVPPYKVAADLGIRIGTLYLRMQAKRPKVARLGRMQLMTIKTAEKFKADYLKEKQARRNEQIRIIQKRAKADDERRKKAGERARQPIGKKPAKKAQTVKANLEGWVNAHHGGMNRKQIKDFEGMVEKYQNLPIEKWPELLEKLKDALNGNYWNDY